MPTPAQSDYYKRLTKLTPEQINQAKNLYYNHPIDQPHTRPTITNLARIFGVSTTVMQRALHTTRYDE